MDFWSDRAETSIRQSQWLAYEDGDEAAAIAVQLQWHDGHNPAPLIDQQVIASLAPGDRSDLLLEIQTVLRPVAETLELGRSDFGLLAVRVAKSISVAFGGGRLTGAHGDQTERDLFGQPSPWIDYSGSVADQRVEGLTYFDHPGNPTFPSKWHVRDDGWMGASICRDAPILLSKQEPLSLRYLLHAHTGHVDFDIAASIAERFHASRDLKVHKSNHPQQAWTIDRTGS